MNYPIRIEGDFMRHEQERLKGGRFEFAGLDENWRSPVAQVFLPGGFGDEIWLENSIENRIWWPHWGDHVYCEWGKYKGRSIAGRDKRMVLQPIGAPNHFRSPGAVKLTMIKISTSMLNQVGEEIGTAVGGQALLRDDLVFFEDHALRRELDYYVKRALDRDAPPSRLEMESRAIILVELLLRRHHLDKAKAEKGGLSALQTKRALSAIEAHLPADLGVKALAEAAGLSVFHFSRAFKKSVGAAPHQYLLRLRIDRARSLLENTHLSILDVAAAVGYDDQGSFARSFRKETGLSPRRYRLGG
ncbi:AraC family transcriptional regulator [uncultured Rhodoblastus sp.]|uniref:helix-turn-helix domain-containing protein n=1 Tax=uncultured Rhodoblastus sp. TaxID=543037 RepID=UPI0025EB370E|nr:AraC family transcriptional regulator [uncultured Rhodoblastus sp.]